MISRIRRLCPGHHGRASATPGRRSENRERCPGVAFGKAEGIVVDTHVFRVSRRMDLTHADTPEQIERDLMQIMPRHRWISFPPNDSSRPEYLQSPQNPSALSAPWKKNLLFGRQNHAAQEESMKGI